MANIELDGSNKEITVDSGDLTLDIPGDIILDADGGDVVFADGGTNLLKITNSSSDVVLQPQVDAKDIIFKQYDGTVVATVEDNATFNVAANKLAINGTAITATAAELNIMDGVTATAAEINIIDGDTARGTTAIADGDGVLINDAGTMRMTNVTTLKTYIGGGITEFDTWRQTSNFQGNTTPIANNWEREDTHLQGNMGTGMSESSGIFTFPSTGYYWVHFNIQFSSAAADNDYILNQIQYTTDNSSYSNAAFSYASIKNNSTYQMCSVKKMFDITDTSNQKVRFNTTSQDDNHYVQTDSSQNGTYAMFMKLGDT